MPDSLSRPRRRTAVRTAAVWAVLQAELDGRGQRGPLRVLDAGGGSGGFAVPLAQLGHRVTVVDASPDALAALERRAAEAAVSAAITPVQGDLTGLADVVAIASQDLVLCHSVLEVVDDPTAALRSVAAVLRPGGGLSLLVANRNAVVLTRALAGRFEEAVHALDDPAGRWGPGDGAVRRFAEDELVALLTGAGLAVESVHGVRVVADLVPGGLLDADPGASDALVALEMAASERAPFRHIATQLHVLARLG